MTTGFAFIIMFVAISMVRIWFLDKVRISLPYLLDVPPAPAPDRNSVELSYPRLMLAAVLLMLIALRVILFLPRQ